jgi:hypothetical protein
MSRLVVTITLLALSIALGSCQLANEQPAPTPATEPMPIAQAGPLPPEETAPPEPTGEPQPAPETKPIEPGITSTQAPTRGTLPKAVIDEKLEAIAPAIRACYEQALKASPGLRGNLSIDFVVAPDGKVAHAAARDTDVEQPLESPSATACIVAEIRKLEFPEPRGGRVFISYPLKFEPPTAKPAP